MSGDHRALDTRAASEIFGSREAHTIGSEGVAIPTPAPCVGSALTSDSSGCVAVVVVVVVVGDMVMGSVCMGGSCGARVLDVVAAVVVGVGVVAEVLIGPDIFIADLPNVSRSKRVGKAYRSLV